MSTQQFSFCYSRSTFDITESKLDLFHLTKQFYRNCISLCGPLFLFQMFMTMK